MQVAPGYREILAPSLSDVDLEQFLLSALAKRALPRPPANLPIRPRDWVAANQPVGDIESSIVVHSEAVIPRLKRCPQFSMKRMSRSVTRGWQAKFCSDKMRRTMRARSHLELRLMELCEVDPAVVAFYEQPIVLTYEMGGKKRRHKPDLYVRTASAETFIEVKWERDAANKENSVRWPLIGDTLSQFGFAYSVLTERYILREPRAKNVRSILRGRFEPDIHDETQAALIRDLFGCRSNIADISQRYGLIDKQIYRLALNGLLRVDIDRDLNGATMVELGDRISRGAP